MTPRWAAPRMARGLILLALAGAANVAPTRASTEPSGAISGVVVDGSTHRPLRGVVVGLTGSRVKVSAATVTDSKGRFVFTDLPAFDGYSLSTTASGYVGDALARRSIFSVGATLALAEGEWRSGLELTMWPLGSISGRVLDERGEPVCDVAVRVLTQTWLGGVSHWIGGPTARTDDRGQYRIGALRAGTYVVNVPSVQSAVPGTVPLSYLSGMSPSELAARQAGAPLVPSIEAAGGRRLVVGQYAVAPRDGGRLLAYPQVFYPASRSLADAAPIELHGGESRTGIVVTLSPVATSNVSGRVTGPPERLADVTLRLFPAGAESLGAGGEQATAMTARDGSFMFAGVPSGNYALRAGGVAYRLTMMGGVAVASDVPTPPSRGSATASALIMGDRSLVPTGDSGADRYFAELPVSVGAGDLRDLIVTLEQGAAITGVIQRDDGRPLPAQVRVRAESASADPTLGTMTGSAEASADGSARFRIDGLARGEYVIGVTAGGLRIKSIRAGTTPIVRSISVGSGHDAEDVTVVLTEQATTVSGTLRETDGRAPGTAAVIVFPVDRTQWTGYGFSSACIDSHVSFGREGYRFVGLPAGEYYIVAVDSQLADAWRSPEFLESTAGIADRVTLRWGVGTRLDLTIHRGVR